MVAINSALQIDLTGQVCSDSIGNQFYSGIGGQVDFLRGASRSKGGKPIIAISSTAKSGDDLENRADAESGGGRGDITRTGALCRDGVWRGVSCTESRSGSGPRR